MAKLGSLIPDRLILMVPRASAQTFAVGAVIASGSERYVVTHAKQVASGDWDILAERTLIGSASTSTGHMNSAAPKSAAEALDRITALMRMFNIRSVAVSRNRVDVVTATTSSDASHLSVGVTPTIETAADSDVMSDAAFEDECAMRAMNRLLAANLSHHVDALDFAVIASAVTTASFQVAAAMVAERNRRRG